MKRLILVFIFGFLAISVLCAQRFPQGSTPGKKATIQHHRSHRVMVRNGTSLKAPATTPTVTARPQLSLAPLAPVPVFAPQGTVSLAPSTPLLTAADPYANPDKPNPLNPSRPYWYSADASGFTILKLADNTKLGSVAWPATIDLAMPDGTTLNVPAPAAGWVPVSMMVPYPSLEAIGPESIEGSSTQALVLMAHSGYEWRSSDRRFRDQIAPAASADTESSMLVMVDVTDPMKPAVVSGALLGHNAGQMAWEPSAGAVYVGNMPSTSLPAGLQSFISKITPPEVGAEPPPPFAPKTLYPLCGPEIEWSGELKIEDKMGIPVNVPEAWICDTIHGAGEGEGPFTYQFTGLPTWLNAHIDKATGEPDGLLYGTPTAVGIYTFVVTVTDHAVEPAGRASAVITIDVKPTVTEFTGGEWEGGEAGVLGALAIQGTGDCTLAPTASGLPLPSWIESIQVPNGCVILGKPTLAGEYYEFVMPNFKFLAPYDVAPYSPVVWSGEVLGTYGFDSLPAGVGISGLAWHEVDMIPGEPDKYVLNGEFIGIDPSTGQLYKDVLPYEQSDTIEEVGPPATIVDRNEVSTEGTPLAGSGFGNLAVEADRDIYVAANGAVIKVSGGTASAINLPGAQSSFLALDSDLAPAVKPDLAGPGQIDHGVLLVTSPNSGNVTVIDTAAGAVSQTLPVPGASSLGGVSIDSMSTGLAYVAGKSLQNVSLFGSGTPWNTAPTIAVINPAEALVDPTVFTIGTPGSMTIIATGWPIPGLSLSGALPAGVTFADNGNGTATVSGAPGAGTEGVYTLTATATNAAGSVSQAFTLTINGLAAPGITSTNSATLTLNVGGQFKVEATGTPTPLLTVSGALPSGVTFHDNGACSPAIPVGCTGSAFLGGIPTETGDFALTITATNSQGTATQEFTLHVSADAPSAIISTDTITFKLLTAGTFTVTATGSPTPKLSETGALPNGVTFTDNLNGTATVAGTPTVVGSYPFTITASNGFGTSATQKFYLVVSKTGGKTELVKTVGISSPSESLALDLRTGDVFAMNAMDVDRPTGRLSTPAITHLDNAGNVIANIPVEQDAEYMAVNSTTHRLYVPQWDRSRETNPTGTDNQGLAIIDTVNNKLLTTIPMPIIPGTTSKYLPTGVAVDEWNNVIYISASTPGAEAAEEGDDSFTPKDAEGGIPGVILAFDGNDNSYLGSVTAGLDPESLVFNPTAKRVYAANEDDGSVTSVAGVTRDPGGTLGDWSAQTPTTILLVFPTTCALSDTGAPLSFGEADKMVVNPVTNKVYITDDAYQIAEIDSATDRVTRILQVDSNCGRPVAANNLALIVDRGAMVEGVPQGILYVASEGNRISIVDLDTFAVTGFMTTEGAQHIDWPVINPQHRLFITDESWPVVFVYDLKDGLTPVPAPFLQTSALSLDFGGIAFGGSSNAQILTISNTGDTTLNITSISFTGDFRSSSNCVTALAAGASCQLAINFNPAGTGARSGMLSITNNAVLSPHQVALFGSGTDFQLAPGAGGSSQTIQSGQSAVYNLNLSGTNGFSGPVVLSCSGTPAASTCNVNPPTLTVNGSTAAPFTVTVATTPRSTATTVPWAQLPPTAWLFCVALLLSLCAYMRLARSVRIRRMAWAAASCGALLIAIAGCGGDSHPPVITGTPAGTYNVTVTATSNGATRTMPLTLVVR